MPIRSQFETEAEWLDHLRSWFAGQALFVSLMQLDGGKSKPDSEPNDLAAKAYVIADAMLAERAKVLSPEKPNE